jgi:hypothetical protein
VRSIFWNKSTDDGLLLATKFVSHDQKVIQTSQFVIAFADRSTDGPSSEDAWMGLINPGHASSERRQSRKLPLNPVAHDSLHAFDIHTVDSIGELPTHYKRLLCHHSDYFMAALLSSLLSVQSLVVGFPHHPDYFVLKMAVILILSMVDCISKTNGDFPYVQMTVISHTSSF